jgi:hypothetical protein
MTGSCCLVTPDLPQVKPADRHTKEGKNMKKSHDGSGYTRSHSMLVPDVANQR